MDFGNSWNGKNRGGPVQAVERCFASTSPFALYVIEYGGKEARLKVMNRSTLSLISVLPVFLAVSCAGNREAQRVDTLKRDPNWPKIHATAEMEVARKEGNTDWSNSAYYIPKQHTNGVWVVVAAGAYPLNRMGDSITLVVRDSGEVVSYAPRWSQHPK